jgi:hypothetical protein
MEMCESVWNYEAFGKNRERLLNEEMAEALFQALIVPGQAVLSDESAGYSRSSSSPVSHEW